MELKSLLVQESGSCFVLPKHGTMRCDVRAFLSPDLLAMTKEDMWAQAYTTASTPGAKGMYLMPDTHLGYLLPIGGVLVTEDTILQAGSGYDISCGVLFLQVPGLTAKGVRSIKRRRAWVELVERHIATGVGSARPDLMPDYSENQVDEFLRFGAKALGVDADQCERQYIPIPEGIDLNTVQKARSRARAQLGSVGGGNHFVEMQVDAADGSVWVMIHCGSRGFGYQTANEFFHRGAEHRGLPKNRREESWLRIDEPLGQEYWAHHNAAANYAVVNRWIIVEGIRKATMDIFNCDVDPYYEISHNLVQEETLMLPDGTKDRGFVHRKGATRAFPAGHPDLVGTKWADTGHPCLIPGSMYDGAAILFPEAGAVRSGCSVNHGSGRVLGRKQAERTLDQHKVNREMETVKRKLGGVMIEGIVSNHRNIPLDECSHSYKDLDQVLRVLTDEGIAKIDRRLFPVANIKGK